LNPALHRLVGCPRGEVAIRCGMVSINHFVQRPRAHARETPNHEQSHLP